MSKYAKYASWLAQVLVCIAAAIAFAKYAKTGDATYSAFLAICLNALMAMSMKERWDKLSEWVVRISDREHALAQSVSSLAAEQLDCKERVDALAKKMDGE